jgi:hypothetical protein
VAEDDAILGAQQQQQQQQEPFNGSAVEWVLRKADESLDEIEENPPEFVKTIYEVSSGPIGAHMVLQRMLWPPLDSASCHQALQHLDCCSSRLH